MVERLLRVHIHSPAGLWAWVTPSYNKYTFPQNSKRVLDGGMRVTWRKLQWPSTEEGINIINQRTAAVNPNDRRPALTDPTAK